MLGYDMGAAVKVTGSSTIIVKNILLDGNQMTLSIKIDPQVPVT